MGSDRLLWFLIALLASWVIVFGGRWAIESAFGADIDKSCLTKAQAEALYPGKWLYWHGGAHCWDIKPGKFSSRKGVYGKTNSLKLGKPPLDANGNVVHHSGAPIEIIEPVEMPRPTIAYPELMSGIGTTDQMLRPDPMTGWPEVYDIDVSPQFIPWQQRITLDPGR